MLADVVDRHDVRVGGQRGGGARLALEAPARAVVLGEVRGQDLDRDGAVEELVVGRPDARHPAGGDAAVDAVAVGQGDRAVPTVAPGHGTQARYRRLRPLYFPRLMARVCHSCGKRPAFGQSRSHSMVATKRRFDPNLQKVRIREGGAPGARTSARAA